MKLKFLLLLLNTVYCYCGCVNSSCKDKCCCCKEDQDLTTEPVIDRKKFLLKFKKSCKYYLSNGRDSDLPLNLRWSNCNCSVLSVFRFFLSDNYFLDKLINKEHTDLTQINGENSNKERNLIRRLKDFIKSGDIMSNVSEVFKNILEKEGNYNSEINQILNVISGNHDCKPYEQLCGFINFYFFEKFYFIKRRQFYLNENINRYDENYDTNDYFMFYNSSNDKVEIKEFIERQQVDKTLKRYELIGIIGICGETDSVKTTESNTDFVSILSVFDKNMVKKGYVIYQFNNKSKVMSIDELNKLERFGTWENPRFHVLIYKKLPT